MIPQTFEEWRHCIVVDCKIELTTAFVASRLAILQEKEHPETIKFVSLYGEQHLNNILQWLKQV